MFSSDTVAQPSTRGLAHPAAAERTSNSFGREKHPNGGKENVQAERGEQPRWVLPACPQQSEELLL